MPGHILVAPDKFKGSLTADQVAEAVAAGLRARGPRTEVRCAPVADGGDGTVRAALASGHYRRVPVRVTGPTGRPVHAEIAVNGSTAVVELASASGLALLGPGESAPMTATSTGTGELVRAALDAGARTIVLGVGGSASTDGGAGMLTALGARLTDAAGEPLPPGGGGLVYLTGVDLSGLDSRLAETEFVLASDVDNPLCGARGAAHVYGPQKGADPQQVELLDGALRRYAEALTAAGSVEVAEAPGAGAAGGVGFAALSVLSAKPRSGTEVVLELVDFDRQLAGADLVVTGEGALDEQTLYGKAPAGVAARAAAAGVPVVAVAGQCLLTAELLRANGFCAVYAIAHVEANGPRRMRRAAALLTLLGEHIAEDWL